MELERSAVCDLGNGLGTVAGMGGRAGTRERPAPLTEPRSPSPTSELGF